MPERHARLVLHGILVGVVAAGLAGWFFGEAMVQARWIGQLFLHALEMLIIPLIFAAVVSGVASMGDIRKFGRLGAATLVYYGATTCVAVAVGLLLVNLIRPGEGLDFVAPPLPAGVAEQGEIGIGDLLLSLVTPNLVAAAAETQLLPLILFAVFLSAALTTLGPTGEHVIQFFHGVNEGMMKLVSWLMYLAPLGIFGLVASRLGEAGGGETFTRDVAAVGLHVATVLAGLTIHFGLLLGVLVVVGRRRPAYLVRTGRALLGAFGTASSSATLPLTMECARESGVDRRAVRFVLPLGATVNMDGTALYEAAAAMFIAQAYGIELGFGAQLVVFVTATLAAIGAAGIPEAGLVTLVIVLRAVGLPLEGIGLLLAVDWFLDRFRTATNVWGDAVGAAVVERFLKDPDPGLQPSTSTS